MQSSPLASRFNRRAVLKSIPAAAVASAGLSAWGSQHTFAAPRRQATPKAGGNLILALPVEVTNYDPYLGGSNHGYITARGLYNTLTRLDETLTPQPELASEWEFSDDGLQLTLHLRPDVQFHSGRPFTAQDIPFAIEATQNPEYAALNRSLVSPITAEVIGDVTVILSTETPYPAIFDALDGLFIVDSETAQPRFPEVGVGTGPFKQGERIPGEYARFDRFDNYWGGPAHLDSFEVRPIPESPALSLALETNAIDAAWRLGYRDYMRLAGAAQFQTLPGADAAAFYDLTINTTASQLADKRVRQAINWSIDRARFAETILLDIVGPTSIPYPSNSLAYDEELSATYTKDLDRARALLTEAGYADGFEASILTSTSLNPGLVELAQIVQADLESIGIRLTIEDVESSVFSDRFPAGEFEIATHTFGRANKDPSTLFGGAVVWYTDPETNPSRFDSDQYRDLVNQGATTLDPDERKAIYGQVTELILDESFTQPIAQQPRTFALLPDVRDFVYTLDNMPLWHQIWLDR